jgi:alpha-glucuronidase
MLLRLCILIGLVAAGSLQAKTGSNAWLRYAALDDVAIGQYRATIPAAITDLSNSVLTQSARQELIRGIRGMLGRAPRVEPRIPGESAIVLGTLATIRQAAPRLQLVADLAEDGFWLKTVTLGEARHLIVTAANERGVLYGAFALLRKIGLGEAIGSLDEKQSPFAPVRWVNQWDNLDGSIERG